MPHAFEPQTLQLTIIKNRELPDMRWAINDILPEGLSILAGRPKMGKSFLAMQMMLAVAEGGHFLGHYQAAKGLALYLALEDGIRRFKSRLEMLLGKHSDWPATGLVSFEWGRLDRGGLEALEKIVTESPYRLVVIDTYSRIKPTSFSKGSAYDQDTADLGPLQALAIKRNMSILLVTHTRKRTGDREPADIFDEVQGTTGITGVVDMTMVLSRKRQADEGKLHVTGRDVQEMVYYLLWNKEGPYWTLAPDQNPDENRAHGSTSATRVLAAVTAGASSIGDIARMSGVEGGLNRILSELTSSGVIRRPSRGVYMPA